jgi:hypothetical protein
VQTARVFGWKRSGEPICTYAESTAFQIAGAVWSLHLSRLSANWHLYMRRRSSMPAIALAADANLLKPSMGRDRPRYFCTSGVDTNWDLHRKSEILHSEVGRSLGRSCPTLECIQGHIPSLCSDGDQIFECRTFTDFHEYSAVNVAKWHYAGI